jgi:peptide/nickel transport system permease protein
MNAPAAQRVLAAFVPVWPFAAILALFVLLAALAPLIAPYGPASQDLLARLRPPGFEAGGKLYLLGTDEVGRDL